MSGAGTCDYIAIDNGARRVYITHMTEVEVLDADSGAFVGKVSGINGAHGVALAPDLGKGFATAGLADQVVIFDMKTLKTPSLAFDTNNDLWQNAT